MVSEKIKIRTLIAVILFIAGIETAAAWCLPRHLKLSILIIGLIRILESLALLGSVLFFQKSLVVIGLQKDQFTAGIKKGLVWSIGFGALACLGLACVYASGMNPVTMFRTHLPDTRLDLAVFLCIGGIVGPIAEELFFRGIIFGFLRRWGFTVALIVSTILFVAPHLPSAGIALPQTIGGILFAVSYEKEKNLIVPMVVHMSGNMAIFMLSVLSACCF